MTILERFISVERMFLICILIILLIPFLSMVLFVLPTRTEMIDTAETCIRNGYDVYVNNIKVEGEFNPVDMDKTYTVTSIDDAGKAVMLKEKVENENKETDSTFVPVMIPVY